MGMAIQSLHYQFPNEYEIYVDIPQKEIFENNPFIKNSPFESGEVIEMNYPLIHRSGRIAYCFAESYVQYIGEKLNIPLRLQCNKCDIFLTGEEQKKYSNFKPYWVVVCSSKQDYTTKCLSQGILNKVVDKLIGKVRFIQPVKVDNSTDNYMLKNVKVISNLTIRDMFSLVYNSSGVICPVTCWHHIAGSFDKNCICIGGNREPLWWVQQYKHQHYLHTAGANLECCNLPCWKSRIIKLGDNSDNDKSLCDNPIFYEDQWLPECLIKIKPETIVDTIERLL